jgi:hypothetical protein
MKLIKLFAINFDIRKSKFFVVELILEFFVLLPMHAKSGEHQCIDVLIRKHPSKSLYLSIDLDLTVYAIHIDAIDEVFTQFFKVLEGFMMMIKHI